MIRWFLFFIPLLAFAVPYEFERRPADPFISGDGFRASCDHAYEEENKKLKVKKMKLGDTIFVETHVLGEFFERIHPEIRFPYILVTHNSDDSAPGPYASYLEDEKIFAWFAENVENYSHPKLIPLPIGVGNRTWPHGDIEKLQQAINTPQPKFHFLYFNMTIQNYLPERWAVYQQFNRTPYCFRPLKRRFAEYLQDISNSIFVLAPRGVGLDTHRLWECLYLGAYPIVKSSTIDSLYEGLPVVVVKDWKEVTEEFLLKKEMEFSQMTFSKETLQMDYWKKLIDSYKAKARNK